MIDTPGYFTIEQIIASTFNRLETDARMFERMATICVEYLTEHNIFFKKGGKEVLLDVSTANTVDLPSDYVDYIRIAIIINGKIWTLGLNPDIPMNIDMSCGTNILPANNITVGEDTTGMDLDLVSSQNLPVYAHHYGVSGGQNYSKYRVDMNRRQIVFSNAVPAAQVYLEYVSSGVSIEGETFVPRQVVPTIRQYLIWQNAEMNDKIPMGQKERLKNQYEQQLHILNAFDNAVTIDEFKDLLYSTSRRTIKR